MKKKKRIFELNLKRKPTKRISLIGLNRDCIIFKKNKLSSKSFREIITHYITIKKLFILTHRMSLRLVERERERERLTIDICLTNFSLTHSECLIYNFTS